MNLKQIKKTHNLSVNTLHKDVGELHRWVITFCGFITLSQVAALTLQAEMFSL